MQERYKIIPACYLVLTRDNEVLLQLRKNTGFMDGKYSLVSGHFEGDETLKQAMIRETKEEAGITLKPEDLELIHVMHRSKKNNDWERVDFFLAANQWEGEIKNTEQGKCVELKWFAWDNLPENVIDYIKEVFLHIKEKRIYSEYGF